MAEGLGIGVAVFTGIALAVGVVGVFVIYALSQWMDTGSH